MVFSLGLASPENVSVLDGRPGTPPVERWETLLPAPPPSHAVETQYRGGWVGRASKTAHFDIAWGLDRGVF
jgi:hypothetical protein